MIKKIIKRIIISILLALMLTGVNCFAFTITKEDDAWVISGKEVERIFKMTKFSSDEAAYRFAKKLKRMGIDEKLKELGAKEGEQVKILDFYFDFKE